ncbi:flagellin N-terminal helical domain-containing protein [Micavibrio aeruginosavorus]|uniref:Flagellar hook-associated protein FliD n=1 Tax=Micavibrio aeruginosavorus EPB TaxID=349215 RepID=M4VGG0_9BACT|nr:flagellin [Micavibrio aeruginosavorus]AGH98457.1 Flagellar hook-associated protein FliD [Micavibrio aeruginosavorus EPB]
MTNDVVLTAALRTNLLSLQNTQSLIDITQNRLATGKKINSALDGPQAFFASQALNNRASDLGRLLDSIGQSIQVIKAADNGVTALTTMVEQADALVTSAREAVANAQSEAKVTGTKDLRGIDDLRGIVGWPADALTRISFTLTTKEGVSRPTGEFATPLVTGATTNIDVAVGTSTEELLARLNSIVDADGNHVIQAELDAKGQLSIKTTNGDSLNMNFTTTTDDDVTNLGLANALGFGDIVKVTANGAANEVGVTAVADVALRSSALHTGTTPPVTALRSDLLANITDSSGNALFGNLNNAADVYTIAINGGAAVSIPLNGQSIQGFIDEINNNGSLNTKIKAEFDEELGQLSIRPIDGSVRSLTIGVTGNDAGTRADFGFGTVDLSTPGANSISEHITFGDSVAELAKLESDYNKLRDQIDALVSNGDTGYRGTNLLFGDDLLTVFNEDRTSSITTEGVTFTADGLGLDVADFSRIDTVETSIENVREALETVRNFGSTLANDLSVIQARQTFTSSMVTTLKEGSALLVNADQNEEGAKLLALQTRQQLGVTALSLASQSQQAILRLFG